MKPASFDLGEPDPEAVATSSDLGEPDPKALRGTFRRGERGFEANRSKDDRPVDLRIAAFVALVGLLLSAPAAAEDVAAAPDFTKYLAASPRCDVAAATHCFGVRLFIAQEGGVPVQTPDWVAAQVREANARLALISVNVELVEVALLADAEVEMVSRADRDALGRARHRAGTIQAYVVRKLADVDIVGNEIYGVHWRDRADGRRRWIILSSIAWPLTFAHELGHYFDLQHHRRYDKSIMHEDRASWPAADLTYAPKELPTMRKALARMLKDATLIPITPPTTPGAP